MSSPGTAGAIGSKGGSTHKRLCTVSRYAQPCRYSWTLRGRITASPRTGETLHRSEKWVRLEKKRFRGNLLDHEAREWKHMKRMVQAIRYHG